MSARRPFTLGISLDGERGFKSGLGWQSAMAFTLVELLVVISIMGLIAALAVPAIKNLGKSNIQASATRQLLDDIGRARQFAISYHTTVYMVFVPTNFFNSMPCTYNGTPYTSLANSGGGIYQVTPLSAQLQSLTTLSNLVDKQLTGYNFISYGQVGDQPGQHQWHYLLSTWQSLPDGTFIAAAKFTPRSVGNAMQIPMWQSDYTGQIDNWMNLPSSQSQIYGFSNAPVPFPTELSPTVGMPCLAFDSTGRLISETPDHVTYHHAYIPLAQGSISTGVDVNKNPTLTTVFGNSITETPLGNSSSISYQVIDVDPLTGRPRMLGHQIQ